MGVPFSVAHQFSRSLAMSEHNSTREYIYSILRTVYEPTKYGRILVHQINPMTEALHI